MQITESDDWVSRLNPEHPEQHIAIEELRGVLLRGMSSTFRNRGMDASAIEDIVQDATLKILDKIDQFEGRSRFTTWAMSITVRLAISEMRKRRYKDVSLEDVAPSDDIKFDVKDEIDTPPAEAAQKNAILGELHRLIHENLTEKQRIVIQAGFNELPLEEIANRIGSNRNAVYKMIHDARVKLRKGLEAAGYSMGDIQVLFG